VAGPPCLQVSDFIHSHQPAALNDHFAPPDSRRRGDACYRYGVISDLDIWRAGNLLIRQHGVDAELESARMADVMLDRGHIEGQRVWLWIRRAIVELQAPLRGRPN